MSPFEASRMEPFYTLLDLGALLWTPGSHLSSKDEVRIDIEGLENGCEVIVWPDDCPGPDLSFCFVWLLSAFCIGLRSLYCHCMFLICKNEFNKNVFDKMMGMLSTTKTLQINSLLQVTVCGIF